MVSLEKWEAMDNFAKLSYLRQRDQSVSVTMFTGTYEYPLRNLSILHLKELWPKQVIISDPVVKYGRIEVSGLSFSKKMEDSSLSFEQFLAWTILASENPSSPEKIRQEFPDFIGLIVEVGKYHYYSTPNGIVSTGTSLNYSDGQIHICHVMNNACSCKISEPIPA